MGDKQRTHIHPFLDPKLAVESIGEVPRVPRAHLEVEFALNYRTFLPTPVAARATMHATVPPTRAATRLSVVPGPPWPWQRC